MSMSRPTPSLKLPNSALLYPSVFQWVEGSPSMAFGALSLCSLLSPAGGGSKPVALAGVSVTSSTSSLPSGTSAICGPEPPSLMLLPSSHAPITTATKTSRATTPIRIRLVRDPSDGGGVRRRDGRGARGAGGAAAATSSCPEIREVPTGGGGGGAAWAIGIGTTRGTSARASANSCGVRSG